MEGMWCGGLGVRRVCGGGVKGWGVWRGCERVWFGGGVEGCDGWMGVGVVEGCGRVGCVEGVWMVGCVEGV